MMICGQCDGALICEPWDPPRPACACPLELDLPDGRHVTVDRATGEVTISEPAPA